MARTHSFPPWIIGLLLFGLSAALFAVILFAAPGFIGTDDYYHTRAATEIMRQGQLALDFVWLPDTLLSPDHYVDHHLLFHAYLAPWATWGGMAGAKAGVIVIAAGMVVMAWGVLRSVGVNHAALWALGMFGLSTPFLSRLLMIRTQGASLLLLLVALLLLFTERHRWLILLAFAYAWLYNGFVLILAFAVLYSAAAWITERRFRWQPVVYTALGLGLGLVINPYFPRNIAFIVEHLGAKVAFEGGITVGNEWYPYRTGTLLTNSAGALLALAIGLVRSSFGGRKRDTVETTLLLVALLTLYMLFKSRRFIEYFPAFALLFAAVSWGRGGLSWADVLPDRVHLPDWLRPAAAPLLVLLAVGILGGFTLTDAYQDNLDRRPVETFAGASAWLVDNTPAGSPVFQTDWDDFPRLFYHNTHNTYLVGLDPTYLERADPDRWHQWVALTRGEIAMPSDSITADFGASYVISDTRHAAFEEQAAADTRMRIVYMDDTSIVWEVLPTEATRVE